MNLLVVVANKIVTQRHFWASININTLFYRQVGEGHETPEAQSIASGSSYPPDGAQWIQMVLNAVRTCRTVSAQLAIRLSFGGGLCDRGYWGQFNFGDASGTTPYMTNIIGSPSNKSKERVAARRECRGGCGSRLMPRGKQADAVRESAPTTVTISLWGRAPLLLGRWGCASATEFITGVIVVTVTRGKAMASAHLARMQQTRLVATREVEESWPRCTQVVETQKRATHRQTQFSSCTSLLLGASIADSTLTVAMADGHHVVGTNSKACRRENWLRAWTNHRSSKQAPAMSNKM